MSETSAPSLPNCLECRHYYVTWDVGFPYGCRAMDFKSRRRPQLDVLASSGAPCLRFEPRLPPGATRHNGS
ncbi:MAG TPA: hypothetical protein VFW59_00710 [Gallionella sp.]|nr:hypothetical protein [Gallionella sp.]